MPVGCPRAPRCSANPIARKSSLAPRAKHLIVLHKCLKQFFTQAIMLWLIVGAVAKLAILLRPASCCPRSCPDQRGLRIGLARIGRLNPKPAGCGRPGVDFSKLILDRVGWYAGRGR